jgi:hypothetical protein
MALQGRKLLQPNLEENDAHAFLIKFILTLSLLLKKHMHLICSMDIFNFYRLG